MRKGLKSRNMRNLIGIVWLIVLFFSGVLLFSLHEVNAASKTLKVKSAKSVAINCTLKIQTNTSATFKSSNRKVATVNKKGVVNGKKPGKVTITVTNKKNKKDVKKIKITVKNQLVVKNPQKSKTTMIVGETIKIKTNIASKYKVNNKNVKVSKKGVITACKVGTSKITITAKKNKKLKKKITIVVKEKEVETTTENATGETTESVTEPTTEKSTQNSTMESTQQNTTQNSTEKSTQQNTTEQQTTTENSTEDEVEPENPTPDEPVDDETGYSRLDWLKAVLETVEIESITVEQLPRNENHVIEYSFYDSIPESDKLVLETALQRDIIEVENGEDGFVSFYPTELITREDAALIAVKALGYAEGIDELDCYDKSSLEYPKWDSIVVNKNLLSLIDGEFCGTDKLSVEDGIAMLERIKEIHAEDLAAPEEICEVEYNDDLIMDSVADITDYTVEETEVGYLVTLPLLDVNAVGLEVGKTLYLPSDDNGLHPDGFACNIDAIEVTETNVSITGSSINNIGDVFDSYHLSGQREVTSFIPADGVTVITEDVVTEADMDELHAVQKDINLSDAIQLKNVNTTFEFKDDTTGLFFSLSMTELPTINFDFKGNSEEIEYIKLTFKEKNSITFGGKLEGDKRVELGEIPDINLGKGFKIDLQLIAVISASGEVSYSVEYSSERGFKYDGHTRFVNQYDVNERGSISINAEVKAGLEGCLCWLDDDWVNIADINALVGLGIKMETTTGATAYAETIHCREESISIFVEVNAGQNENSLLGKIFEKLGMSVSWRPIEVPIFQQHAEALATSPLDYQYVLNCTAVINALSGKVLDKDGNIVTNAAISIQGVDDDTFEVCCFSDSEGRYSSNKKMAIGTYIIKAKWDERIRYEETVQLTEEDLNSDYNIIESGCAWGIENGILVCEVDESVDIYEVVKIIKQQGTFDGWFSQWELNLKGVKLLGKVGNESMEGCFEDIVSTQSGFTWYLNDLDVSNVTDMSSLFAGAGGSFEIDQWNTGNVTDMSYMFMDTALYKLDLSKWDTSNVTDMSYMFKNSISDGSEVGNGTDCDINLSNWNTRNVINIPHMFENCSGIEEMKLDHFDTSNVTDMSYMFAGCSSVICFDISNFDTSNVKNMSYMFYDFSGAKVWSGLGYYDGIITLDLSHFDTKNVTDMSCMFAGNEDMTSINVEGWSTSNVLDMSSMFGGCDSLININFSQFDTSNATDMSYMFSGGNVANVDISGFDTSNVINMSGMFKSCSGLSEKDFSNFNTSSVKYISELFAGCDAESLDLSTLDMSNISEVCSFESMFENCTNLKSLNLSGFDTSCANNMSNMFSGCTNLQALDLSSFETAQVYSMENMFSECSSLQTLDLSDFDTTVLSYAGYMFSNCSGLQSLDFSTLNTGDLYSVGYMFSGCSGLQSLQLGTIDLSEIYYIDNMFEGCPASVIPDWYIVEE